ncbi:T-box transcription factor T [Bienertia sinuspersici]
MISPNPLSLFCAILLCFPLALVLTISSNPSSIVVTQTLVTLSPPPPPKPISKPTKLFPPKNPNSTIPINKISSKQSLNRQLSSPPPPSPSPADDKDDIKLLKQATRVNPYTVEGRTKKVAFLFLTTTPLPFAPLWELFFNQSGASTKGKYNIYIHADPTAQYNPPFSGVFSGRVIPTSKPTRRNTPTLSMAARRLLAHALLDDPDNYMFTLLSGACIPLHSFNFTYTTLVTSNKSFVEIFSNESTRHGRWAARGDTVMLPEVSEEDFRVGSQFWSLTRRQARVVVEDTKLWRKFGLPCVDIHACYPEENYFPTLLSMVDPHGVVPATLTSVDWRGRHDGHPRTYKSGEVDPGLIRWLREARPVYGIMRINGSNLSVRDRWDPFLFARKFGPDCLEPLLSMAKDILFKD